MKRLFVFVTLTLLLTLGMKQEDSAPDFTTETVVLNMETSDQCPLICRTPEGCEEDCP